MACNLQLPYRMCYSFAYLSPCIPSSSFPYRFTSAFPTRSSCAICSTNFLSPSVSLGSVSGSFTWDDVVRVSQPECIRDDPSDLKGYFENVSICNRGSGKQDEFLPFVVENQIVGYVHNVFANHLKGFRDVFVFDQDSRTRFGVHVALHPSLKTPADRTIAVGDVVKSLGEELIPGRRNELYPVTSSFGAPLFLSLERAAAAYFGIKTYGVYLNGYVEKDGEKFLWITKRSQLKPIYPGMLDHLVAGGQPHGITCRENLMKECKEEAGIPTSISNQAIPVGVVSYTTIDGFRYHRDVLFSYDLKLPESFIPKNQDGEVEGFKLIPATNVANVVRRTHFFKPNGSIGIIDFLFRHGYIHPEYIGYLDLLRSLRSGDCS